MKSVKHDLTVGAITTALDKYYPRVLSASIDFGAPEYVSNVVVVRIGNEYN